MAIANFKFKADKRLQLNVSVDAVVGGPTSASFSAVDMLLLGPTTCYRCIGTVLPLLMLPDLV